LSLATASAHVRRSFHFLAYFLSLCGFLYWHEMGNGPSVPENFVGYITAMTPEQLTEHERNCRPDHGRVRNSVEPYIALGQDWFSDTGFINDTESLIEVARCDEATVVRLLGADGHSIIARALMMLMYTKSLDDIRTGAPHLMLSGFDTDAFDVAETVWCGYQKCPFIAHTPVKLVVNGVEKTQVMIGSCGHQPPASSAGTDYKATNKKTSESFTFSGLMPHLIYFHHFYEGTVPHRLDPETVIRVLGLTSEMK